MLTAAAFAASVANRWLLAGILAAAVVLGAATYARDASRRRGAQRRGTRRRAGALIALGPVIGLVFAPELGDLTLVIALGAVALALAGAAIERARHTERLTFVAAGVSSIVAVAAGARLGPTGVGALDVLGALIFILVVMKAIDGLGNADGLAAGSAVFAAASLFAVAAFAHQDGLAGVFVGFGVACFAFLAFNIAPASLFVGRGGRLTIGFVLAVGALAVDPVAVSWRELLTPVILLGIFLLDGTIVVASRLRRRRSLIEHRKDHILHRLIALGWTRAEAVSFLIVCQFVLSVVALFTARGVFPLWLTAAASIVVLLLVGVEAGRAKLEREQPRGLSAWARLVVALLVAWIVVATAPLALAANDTVDLMQQGREAATRALNAARDGDSITARGAFDQAAQSFSDARAKLESPVLATGLTVPFLASNVRAARTLSEIGTDLANAGESLTAAVDPDALQVVDGRLPVEEVRKVTPDLEHGAQVLTEARARLDALRGDPYLVSQVGEAVDKVYTQLARADREAHRAAAAARLAPAIFGADGDRTYLLVVQNNAESRATGGFIGSYALITAHDGKLHVGDMMRTTTWNAAIREGADVTYTAPADYKRRYAQYRPETTLQNVNLSPDFPSVADALMSLAPQAGQPKIDGVLSVDPAGLAALLQLTGPVDLPDQWPTPIDSGNVVNVTLRDAYQAFADTPDRADFLGDVARAAVDKATTGTLGKPAQIAKVLGGAAHAGHLILSFARPEEQQLAEQLDVSGRMDPVRSDAVAVTSSNAGGNKIDYYLERDVDYRVVVTPNNAGTQAIAEADLSVTLDNTAPAEGLPQIVIGPYTSRFVAGENRALLSLYSPLQFVVATVDGAATAVSPGVERGRNVYSLFEDVASKTRKTTATKLEGPVKLHDGWYSVNVRAQPTLNPDRLHVSIDVPRGWKIDHAPKMEKVFARRASATLPLEQTTTFRVHIVPDTGTQNLWDRLVAGG